MLGLFPNNQTARKAAFKHRRLVSLSTGDLGVMDQDGTCRIVGASRDIIIRGGD